MAGFDFGKLLTDAVQDGGLKTQHPDPSAAVALSGLRARVVTLERVVSAMAKDLRRLKEKDELEATKADQKGDTSL
jgi:hypothetical protein